MLTIGCHLSKRRGYLEMAKEAASINANTFQYFTRSPRGSEQAALDEKDVAAYLAFAKEHGIHDALAYAPYDADPATDKMNERDFALMVYSEDLARLAEVDGSLYLIRPGSRLNISVEEGLADVADALNKAGNAALLADGGPGITVRAGAEPLQPGDIPRGGGTARPTPEGTAEGDSCPESPEPRGSAPEGREALQCRDNAGEGLPDGERSC